MSTTISFPYFRISEYEAGRCVIGGLGDEGIGLAVISLHSTHAEIPSCLRSLMIRIMKIILKCS